MSEVLAWEARLRELQKLIDPLEVEQATLEKMIREAKSPFKTGDVIEWANGGRSGGKRRCSRGRVLAVKNWCNEYKWYVRRILKHGSDGKEVWVYPWQNPRRQND